MSRIAAKLGWAMVVGVAVTGCRPVATVPVVVTNCSTKDPLADVSVSVEFGPAGFGNQTKTDNEGKATARFPKDKPSRLIVEAEGYGMSRKDYRRPPDEALEVCLERSGSTTTDEPINVSE